MRHRYSLMAVWLCLLALAACAGEKPDESWPSNTPQQTGTRETPLTVTYPTAADTETLTTAKEFLLKGTASIDVSRVEVYTSCDARSHVVPFRQGQKTWEFPVSITKGTLCRWENEYTVSAFSTGTGGALSKTLVRVESDTGLQGSGQLLTMRMIDTLVKRGVESVKTDPAIVTKTKEDAFAQFCSAIGQGKDVARPQFFTPVTAVSDDLWIRVRTSVDGDEKAVVQHWGLKNPADIRAALKNSPVLAFFEQTNVSFRPKAGMPPVVSWSCPFVDGFTVYHLRPDRIIVSVQGGFETYPVAYLFDGKTWHSVYDLLYRSISIPPVYRSPLLVQAHANGFSLVETRYCCDIVPTVYPGHNTEFVFDLDTLTVTGAVLH